MPGLPQRCWRCPRAPRRITAVRWPQLEGGSAFLSLFHRSFCLTAPRRWETCFCRATRHGNARPSRFARPTLWGRNRLEHARRLLEIAFYSAA